MEMKEVKSSTIKSMGYDESSKIMAIKFLNGTVYHYSDIPKELYENIINSNSIGGAFHYLIKSNPNIKGEKQGGEKDDR